MVRFESETEQHVNSGFEPTLGNPLRLQREIHMTYLSMVDTTSEVLLHQAHSEIEEWDEKEWVSVEYALDAANAFNIGQNHPDVYIDTPYHDQVVDQHGEIIGFVENEAYGDMMRAHYAVICQAHVWAYKLRNIPF